jgi:tyrosine-protein kinase Etk/Wzc
LYILRQNYTLKKQLKMIDELYESKKLPKISLLINDVKDVASNRHYGGYGYGYGHGSKYFEEEKTQPTNIFGRIKSFFTW